MKKLLISCFVLFIGGLYAQNQSMTSGVARTSVWTFGGNVGVSGGSGGLGIFISPRVGYKLTPDLEATAIANYTFLNSSSYRNSMFGIGPAINYYLGRYAYFHSSFQHYMISQYHKNTRKTFKTNEDALYIGGGYMQNIGGNAYLQVGASYNVLYKKDKSVFSGGFVPNIGVVIGL